MGSSNSGVATMPTQIKTTLPHTSNKIMDTQPTLINPINVRVGLPSTSRVSNARDTSSVNNRLNPTTPTIDKARSSSNLQRVVGLTSTISVLN